MVSNFLDRRNRAILAIGALAAPILGGLAARLLVHVSELPFGGTCELAWAILALANRHRDPLWIGLTAATIATPILFLIALANGLNCDDVNAACGTDHGPEIRFDVALVALLGSITAILMRAAARTMKRERPNRERGASR